MTLPIIQRNDNPMLDTPTQALLNIFLREAYREWEVSYLEMVRGLPLMSVQLFERLPTSIKNGIWDSSQVTIGSFASDSSAKDYLKNYLLPVIPKSLQTFFEFKYFSTRYHGGCRIIIIPKPGIIEQITPAHLDSLIKATFTKAVIALDYAVINVNGSRTKFFYSESSSGAILHYFIDSIFQEPTLTPARIQEAPRSSETRSIPSTATTVSIEQTPPNSWVDSAIFSSITDAIMLGIALLYLAISASLNVFVGAIILAVDLLYLAINSSIALLQRSISTQVHSAITDSVERTDVARVPTARARSSQRTNIFSLTPDLRQLLRQIRDNRVRMEQSYRNTGIGDTPTAPVEPQADTQAIQTIVDVVSDLSAFTEAPTDSPSELVLEVNPEVAPTPELVQALVQQETPILVENASLRVEPTGLDLALLTETLNDNTVFAAPIAAVSHDSFENVVVISSASSMVVVDAPSPAPVAAANKTFTHTTASTDVALWDTAALLSNVRMIGIRNLSSFEELNLDSEEFTDAPDKAPSSSAQPAVIAKVVAKASAPAPKARPDADLEMKVR